MVTRRDGAAARARWVIACRNADREIRAARATAREAGEHGVVTWLSMELGQLAVLQAGVTGKRWRPSTQTFGILRRGPVSSGLFHDVPVEFQEPEYRPLMGALDEVRRLFESGVDVSGWDWTRGFPPGWHASLVDRLRAYVPVHDA
jgi:hypothetical protein